MKQKLLPFLFLLIGVQTASALEPYFTLSSDNSTMKFYYDNEREARGGESIFLISTSNQDERGRKWKDQRESVTMVVFDDSFAAYTSLTSTAYWFSGFVNLTSIIGIEKLNTANVMYMSHMFERCSALASLDVSRFNTANVKNMEYMFDDCSALTSLDVSRFNTANVTNMEYMFNSCRGLTSLDVSHFNTAKVTKMNGMFSTCQALTSLEVSHFNTANVTRMDGMFDLCNSLTSLDVSNFNTANVMFMGSMFSSCRGLTSLDVSNFNTAKVISMSGMFMGCSGLTSLDVSNFNTANVTDMRYMFSSCSALKTIYCNDTWSCDDSSHMFSSCVSLKGAIAWSESKTDVTYANPDTGYFTKTSEMSVQTLNAVDGQQDAPIYNLSGQRLNAPQKGINIIGGKKYVVK